MSHNQDFEAVRFFRMKKKPVVMKRNLSEDQAQEFTRAYPTKRSRRYGINSFVGYRKM